MPKTAPREERFERWLPVRFRFRAKGSSVIWVNFGAQELTEPFFNHQMKRLQRKRRSTRKTTIPEFLHVASLLPPASPNGYICHVSRCGSTLLANAMKVGDRSTVLSEAHPLYQILNREDFRGSGLEHEDMIEARRTLANALIALYAALFGKPVVVKGHTVDILQIAKLRVLWPKMPIVINIRHPAEVLASNLEKPGDWIRSALTAFGRSTLFGPSGPDFRQMSIEEYGARGLKRFYEAAHHDKDDTMRVVDYAEINAESVRSVARFFHLPDFAADDDGLLRVLTEYSKNPRKTHTSDEQRKRRSLTSSAHKLVDSLTLNSYIRLLSNTEKT